MGIDASNVNSPFAHCDGDANSGVAGRRRARKQADRRDIADKVERVMKRVAEILPRTVLESEKVDGQLLEDTVKEHFEKRPSKKLRISEKQIDAYVQQFGGSSNKLNNLKPNDRKEKASDNVVEALRIAFNSNNKMRDHEPLINLLQSIPSMTEKDGIGLIRNLYNSRDMAKQTKFTCYVEFLKHVARTSSRDKHEKVITAFTVDFQEAVIQHAALVP